VSPVSLPHGLSGRDELPRYFDRIVESFAAALHGDVLDHGAGTGVLAERLALRATMVVALEPDALLFEQLTRRFSATPNVTPLCGTIETYLSERGPHSLDAVVSSNVLEHLADDVGCLRQIREALRPGGAVAVYVPARAELFGSLDRNVGHLRRYSRTLLRSRLEAAGFSVEWTRYSNLVGVLPWLVSGRLLGKRSIAASSLRSFDRFVLPLGARLEDWLQLPYGLNVAALARRQ
jgi:SAM-dependent methyltransferase